MKPSSSDRIASTWTTTESENSSFTIDLTFNDSSVHQVAIYCVDWLGTGTILEKIQLFDSTDATFSHPPDTRMLTLPSNGIYFVWKLSGHKILRITKPDATTGNKAMISALLFDPAP